MRHQEKKITTVLYLMATAVVMVTTGLTCVHGDRNEAGSKRMLEEVNDYIQSDTIGLADHRGFGGAAGFNVAGCLPEGYVKDASIDYTSYIQQAIDTHDSLVFPPFPLLIAAKGLTLHSNQKIFFEKGSQLRMTPNDRANYDVISIRDCHDVSLFGPSVRGDKKEHTGDAGEWGMGIGIYGSRDIEVFDPQVSDTWGDGIYIGRTTQQGPSSHVYIKSAVIQNCRRNGISVTSGENITLADPVISNSNGTLPMDGIDIEPNDPSDKISGIRIINPVTKENKGYGIEFSLSKLYGGSTKNVDAMVLHHTDEGSKSAAYVSCSPENVSAAEKKKITGIIVFRSPKWKNSRTDVWRTYGLTEKNITLALIDPLLYDADNNLIGPDKASGLLKKEIFPGSSVLISK